jgi:hypothetical protein
MSIDAGRRRSLEQRIVDACAGQAGVDYWTLLERVFPVEQYPRAYRYASQGGPPGVAMIFGAALRRLNAHVSASRRVYLDRNEVIRRGLQWPGA